MPVSVNFRGRIQSLAREQHAKHGPLGRATIAGIGDCEGVQVEVVGPIAQMRPFMLEDEVQLTLSAPSRA